MSSQSSPAWVVKTIEPRKPSIETAVIRGFLLRPNLSTIAEVNASIIDIDDDSPATTRQRKNMAPKRFPPGIRLTAWG